MKDKDIKKYFNSLYIKLLDVKYDLKITQKEFLALNEVHNLITRQQAEIERLQSMNQAKLDTIHDLQVEIDGLRVDLKRAGAERDARICTNNFIKSEAYKEFADKLKEFMHNKFKALDEYEFEYITERDINNRLKETVGDDNARDII